MTLKKYFYSVLAVAGVVALTACSADEGTDPGSDSAPAVTLYTYAPGSEYNADEDVMIRIAPNNKVAEIYYKSELTTAVQEYIAANGENAYADQVVASGTKLEGGSTQDFVLTGLLGNYTITAVGVAENGRKAVASTTFQGLTWTPITAGTITYGTLGQLGLTPAPAELQKCDVDETLYRVKDMYGKDCHLKFTVLDLGGTDSDGSTFKFCRVANQNTGLNYGSYGAISVQDVGYWQGDESYVTGGGFDNCFYVSGPKENQLSFILYYYVSAGYLGYQAADVFTPNN
ncbi:hypothetical protein [Alistipes sp.]|uniref:hypothetical protein n=1 Tax=Alistipes sp. TaxID=1872444 RepID=UPI0025C5BE7E|nr:hypothetical protein [Alistipes sp.]MCI7139646.1 hypothetical protein [Alistipes sp.]MDY5396611.1 hypothetical protein [Alistipes sp.]